MHPLMSACEPAMEFQSPVRCPITRVQERPRPSRREIRPVICRVTQEADRGQQIIA